MLYNEWPTIEENNQSDKSIKQEKAVEACNRKTISLAIRLTPACKKRDVLHRCAGGAHQSSESRCALVNLRPAGAALVDMGYRVGANW